MVVTLRTFDHLCAAQHFISRCTVIPQVSLHYEQLLPSHHITLGFRNYMALDERPEGVQWDTAVACRTSPVTCGSRLGLGA